MKKRKNYQGCVSGRAAHVFAHCSMETRRFHIFPYILFSLLCLRLPVPVAHSCSHIKSPGVGECVDLHVHTDFVCACVCMCAELS